MRSHCGAGNFQKHVSQFCTAAADQLTPFIGMGVDGSFSQDLPLATFYSVGPLPATAVIRSAEFRS